MTDKELLELAAKAAGISGSWFEDCNHMIREFVFDRRFGIKTKTGLWNPLTDDGDALRLAVKLNLLYGKVFARSVAEYHEDGDDIYAATRRAIVRAAAQIGKEMK